jgi:membrane fusion protein (multidrug efflux system)
MTIPSLPMPFRRTVRGLCGAAALFVPTLAPAAVAVQCLTEAVGDVEMSSPVSGTVAVIHHGEGKFVEAGTVVLELESRTEQLDVERRKVQVDTLAAELARSETLLKSTSSISREEVDKKRGEHRVATVELEVAKEALARRRVVAPFSGVVTLLPVKVGEYCQPPRVLLRLVDARKFYAIANIDPAAAKGLAEGSTVWLEAGPDTPEKLEGKIVFISPVIDSASGLLRIKALFTNPGTRLRPGIAGQLHLP